MNHFLLAQPNNPSEDDESSKTFRSGRIVRGVIEER
jgi:hypothetical protein